MADQGKDWSAVVLAAGAELIVGWRPRPSRLDAEAVELSKDVARDLRDLCTATLGRLAALRRRPYGGSPYIEPDEEYLAVPPTDLPRPPAGEEPVEADEGAALSDLERRVATAGLPSMSRETLRQGNYLFYAVICTDRAARQRIGFVRQKDPHRVAHTGALKAVLGAEGLDKLTDPLFVFDAEFDLVVAPDEIAVLRLEAFNRMFADLNTLVSAAPANAKLIAEAIGGLTAGAVDTLAKAAAARPSLARRLQRLARPGVTPTVTPADLAGAMSKHSLEPTEIVSHDEIRFTEDKAAVFLDLIEQLYYETDFTKEHRRSDRYSPLSGGPARNAMGQAPTEA